jgi:hypothetical protein
MPAAGAAPKPSSSGVSNVRVTVGVGTLTLEWETPFRAIGGVRYRLRASQVWAVRDEEATQPVTLHRATLVNLRPQATYELQLHGKLDAAGYYESSYFSIQTR